MRTVCLTLAGVLLCVNAFAATITWTNTSGGSWSNPTNWSPNQIPAAGDTADVTTSGTYNIVLDGDATLAVLNLGAASGEQTVSINSPDILTIMSEVLISQNGILNMNASGLSESRLQMTGRLTVDVGGVLNLAGAGSKTIASPDNLTLLNRGTVNLIEGWVYMLPGITGTVITNQGLWDIQGDVLMVSINVAAPGSTIENVAGGIIRKSGGSGTAQINYFAITNQGVIESAMGTLQLGYNYENTGGTLRLSGGRIEGLYPLRFSGGVLEGSGTMGQTEFVGGTISPGLNGPGKITFASGLNLGAGVSLLIDAKGPVPGDDYDQIVVTGGVNITNSLLSFTPTASLPVGTKLVIIENDSTNPVAGMFEGFADGTLFDANNELYRSWYQEGTGNDFAIVRTTGGARLKGIGLDAEGGFVLSGFGTNNATYTIFATPNIPTNVWEELGNVIADPTGKFEFIDPDAHLFNMRFYRSLGP